MKGLPENFVGYFGTNGRSGHNLYVLDGYKELSDSDVYDWAAEFDRDFIMMELSSSSLKVFWWKTADVTICGYPKSIDDNRPGSKSLFIIKGNHTGNHEYIVSVMKSYPWVYDIFTKITEMYLKD